MVVHALPVVSLQLFPESHPGAPDLGVGAGHRLLWTLAPVVPHVLPLGVESTGWVRAVHLDVWALVHVTTGHVAILAQLLTVRAGVVPEKTAVGQVALQGASEEGLPALVGALYLSILAPELVFLQRVQVPRPLAGVVPVGAHHPEGFDAAPARAVQERLERLATRRAASGYGPERVEAQSAVDLAALARRLLRIAGGEEADGADEVVRYVAHEVALVTTAQVLQVAQRHSD